MVILLFLFGLIIGSFLNVVILRLPIEKHLQGRSECPQCHRQLSAGDLIPVLSFVFLKGRCRGCHKPISIRYPALELVVGLLFALGAVLFPPISLAAVLHLVLFLLVVSIGLVTFVIDYEHYLILDAVTGFGVVAVIVLQLSLDIATKHTLFANGSNLRSALLGAVCGVGPFLLLWLVSRGKWLGFGDVKYMVFMGATLGATVVWVGMLLSFWIGALVSVPLLLLGRKKMKSMLPFGTFLVVGQVIAFLYGHELITWYWRLLT